MPGCNTEAQNVLVNRARQLLAAYENMAELIRLGAYRKGADPLVDEAISYYPQIEAFIGQRKTDRATLGDGYMALAEVLDMDYAPGGDGGAAS
jgi:flagellum-specific ATP synthase